MLSSVARVMVYIRAALTAWIEGESSGEPFLAMGKLRQNMRLAREVRSIRNVYGELEYIGLTSPWLRDVQLFAADIGSVHAFETNDEFVPMMVVNAYATVGWQRFHYTLDDIRPYIRDGTVLTLDNTRIDRPWLLNLDLCDEISLDLASDISLSISRRRNLQQSPTAGIVAVTFRCCDAEFPRSLLSEMSLRIQATGAIRVKSSCSRYTGNFGESMGHVWMRIDS
jgi:hypothetical protein